jgi:hypothetical protein
MKTDTDRITELEAQIALLKSTLKEVIETIRVSEIELETNIHGDFLSARNDWDKADLAELKRALN